MAKYNVSSFPPEYLELLKAASTKAITFTLPHRDCITYRANLYSLRAALRREGHVAAEVVNVVKITIKPDKVSHPDDPAVIKIAPRDVEFATLIRRQLDLPEDTAIPVTDEPAEVFPRGAEGTGEFDYLAQVLAEGEEELEDDEPTADH